MGSELKFAREKIDQSMSVILAHYAKIKNYPNAITVVHWQKEISGQIKAIARRLHRLKRRHGNQNYFAERESVESQLTPKDVERLNQLLRENSRN
ncbi:hypothetical protein HYR99_19995 [Candidatus Poribacteria bacterium]|nr:hypothetical protein [Candidatus Poribacteria bacterium]